MNEDPCNAILHARTLAWRENQEQPWATWVYKRITDKHYRWLGGVTWTVSHSKDGYTVTRGFVAINQIFPDAESAKRWVESAAATVPNTRAQGLADAANYLRERAERLRKLQVKNYSGERDRNINALIMWANQVRKL